MFERIKVVFLSWFLKKAVSAGQSLKPKRCPEEKGDTDLPRFIDRYSSRTSEGDFPEITEKVRQAVANLKAKGHYWRGGE